MGDLLKSKAQSGVKWTTFSTVTITLCAILKVSVLARYLDKADFGLMAIVAFVLGITNLFVDMGLTIAILHYNDISKKEYYSLYWMNMIFSIFLFLMICAISPLVVAFYDQPELRFLLPLMGSSLIISSLGKQFRTIEQKKMNFRLMSVIDVVSQVLALGLAIILALKDFGVYSLVYSALLQYSVVNTFYLIYGLKNEGLRLYFKPKLTYRFFKVGIYQVGGQIVNYFNRDLDILIIGKLLGAEVLGGYSLAKQLVFRPASLINPVLTRVASPYLSHYQNNLVKLKRSYLELVNKLTKVNGVVYLGLGVMAPLAVKILYGSEFLDIVPVVRILCIYMFFRSIGNPIGSLVIATGRTDLEFKWNILSLILFPISIVVGSYWGMIGVAWSITIVMMAFFYPAWLLLVNRMIPIPFKEYLYMVFFKVYPINLNIKRS